MARKGKGLLVAALLAGGLLFVAGAKGEDEDVPEPGPEPEPEPEPEPFVIVPGVFEPEHEDPFVVAPGVFDPEPAPDEPDPDPDGPFVIGPATMDPEAWDPSIYEDPENYPTGGVLHQVIFGDKLGGTGSRHNIAWAVLYEAAYDAAIDVGGLDDAGAREYAAGIASKGWNRIKYMDLILCSPFNDLAYGTWGYSKKSHAGPHGRSIRMLRMHADNRSRIFDRLPPIRNIEWGSPADKKTGNAGPIESEYADTHEYLWLPPLNHQRLWEAGAITTEGLTWQDGSTALLPPPEIWALGVHVMEDPEAEGYGCLGAEAQVA